MLNQNQPATIRLPDPWNGEPSFQIGLTFLPESRPLISPAAAPGGLIAPWGDPNAVQLLPPPPTTPPAQILLQDELKIGRRASRPLVDQISYMLTLLYWHRMSWETVSC